MKMSSTAIDKLKEYIKRTVVYAKYKSGSSYTQINIHKVEILPDDSIGIYILLDHNVPNNISEIQFYDVDGDLWASGIKNINKEAFQEGILYRYKIKLEQS